MAKKVEEIQEQRDVRDLNARLNKLPPYIHEMIVEELINVVCFGLNEVNREWLEAEISAYERIERKNGRNIL